MSDLIKEALKLDKMCVSEIVAKYESSWNAITVLKRKFRQACESDDWMEKAKLFYQDGGCPICFSTDEVGHEEGCYLGQIQQQRDDLLVALKRTLGAMSCDELNNGQVFDDDLRKEVKEQAYAAIAKCET